ncbi:hypothetical protein HHK36_019904 [Tetracentron sinense]|uniref:Pentatricopeptide repeat-containing protein n=1 Tax=Tetracentron sinense TaxID=13715 RepID=A0A834Z0Q0_TETSI|nr:hypothetical protein HHK36_019904 [Tetracentron sinense]
MAMEAVKKLQAHLIRSGFRSDPIAMSDVLCSYADSPSNLHKAIVVFNQIKRPTMFNWNWMIHCFSQRSDRTNEAICMYSRMRCRGVVVNLFVFKACARIPDIRRGQKIHVHSLKLGFHSYLFVSNALISMYAREMFDVMLNRDLVSFNSLICGHSQSNRFREVLSLFKAMQGEKVKTDAVTMLKVVFASSQLGYQNLIDSTVKYIEENVKVDVYLGNTLLDLYGRRECLEFARKVFDMQSSVRDRPSRSSHFTYGPTPIPQCILSSNRPSQTHLQLSQLDEQHLLTLLLKHTITRRQLIQIHSLLITTGLYQYGVHSTWMIIWNTLLRKYSLGILPEEALKLYKQLQDTPPSLPVSTDSFTYSFLLKACANLDQPIKGVQIHAHIIKVGFEFHVYVQTALVNMYSVCGCLSDATQVFNEMPERNSVTWNAMITGLTKWGEVDLARSLFDEMPNRTVISWTGMIDGYTRSKHPKEALALFRQMMVSDGIKPTEITILAILPAISYHGALDICQSIHTYGEKNGFNASDIRITNSLIDTYAKCGCIESAVRVFEDISSKRRNLVSWTSIISGLAMHGMAKEAVEQFDKLAKACLNPNRVTFLSVLNACSHGGLVEEGLRFFSKMVNVYQIIPDIKHYGCLIDMLGRAGRLAEAEKMVLEMPRETVNVVVWRTLLGACSFHGNVEMGERVMRKILETERRYSGDYVLLSNIFSGVGRFGDAERVRKLMDERNVFKVPGLSLI